MGSMEMGLKEVKMGSQSTSAADMALEWGWQSPPKEILALAQEAAEAKATVSGELFVKRGIITAARRDELLRAKPSGVQTIAWFAQQDNGCMQASERLTALKSGYPFYDSLSFLTLHPKMAEQAVAKRAEELDVAVMMIEGARPVLVFSSTTHLYKYKAMGREERRKDPIAKAVEVDVALLFAIGARDQVSEALKTISTGDSTGGQSDGNNVWSFAQNPTPEGREFARMLDHAISEGVTDIALMPIHSGEWRVMMRKFGNLVRPKSVGEKISTELSRKMRYLIERVSGANPNNTEIRLPTDGQITYRSGAGDVFLRLSFIPLNHPGDFRNLKSVSIRLLPRAEKGVNLGELRLNKEVIEELRFVMQLGQGLVAVVGPTNSGKSTTMAGAVGLYQDLHGETKKVLTIEEPIERFIPGTLQFQVPTSAREEERFALMLRAFKRHDPDMVWVGEVRDKETADVLVAAGSAGTMTLATLHANDGIMGFDVLARMVDEGKRYQYVESLALILSQRLVAELCPTCRTKGTPTPDEETMFNKYVKYRGIAGKSIPQVLFRANPEGCKKCYCGYAGEIPINEVLTFNRRVKDAAMALLEGRLIDGLPPRKVMEEQRSLTLFDSGLRLLMKGQVDLPSLLQALPF